jgi:uncharacterized membrane protein YhaH (DUF805 family)
MSPSKLYFSASGRIGPRTFWRAIILLLAVQVAVQLIFSLLPMGANPFLGVLSWAYNIVLLIIYINVYSKRLHDAGRGAGWFLLCFIGFVILSGVVFVTGILTVAPEIWRAVEDMVDALSAGRSGQVESEIVNARILESQFSIFAINLAALFITNFVIGWFVARLPSDPGVNRFGPPEGGGNPDVFN